MSEANQQPKEMLPSNEVANAQRKKKRQPNQELSFLLELMGRFELLASSLVCHKWQKEQVRALPAELSAEQRSCERHRAHAKVHQQTYNIWILLYDILHKDFGFEIRGYPVAPSLVCHKWQKEQVRALPAELSAEQRSCERHRAQAKVYQQIQTKNTTEQVCGVMEL